VIYISPRPLGSATGGGAVYDAAVRRLLGLARPSWKIVDIRPAAAPTSPVVHRLRRWRSALAALGGGAPALARFAIRPEMQDALDRTIAEGAPDLLVLDGPDVALLADQVPAGIPRLLVGHNIEHRLLRDRIASMSWPGRVLVEALLGEPARYTRFETAVWHVAAAAIHISASEAAELPATLPRIVIPPVFAGPPPPAPALQADRPLRIGFVGKLTWWPNREGIDWLLAHVWPSVPLPAELHLFGLGSEAMHAPSQRVFGHGFVADATRMWSDIDLVVVPALSGGGVNVKLCEALWAGRPCLATTKAVRGLPRIDDPALLCADSAEDWAAVLSGRSVRHLAEQRPSQSIRTLFDETAAARLLAAWLDGLGFDA
jgi:glycosyltransferase involved in cell wall biosynthesis